MASTGSQLSLPFTYNYHHVTTLGEDHSVKLNVYDLHWSISGLNKMLVNTFGIGAFHVGVELFGVEYMFANGRQSRIGPEESGIIKHIPRNHSIHVFREVINLGQTSLSPHAVRKKLDRMKAMWTIGSYNIVHRNCIHFAMAFAEILGASSLPSYITAGCDAIRTAFCRAGAAVSSNYESKQELRDEEYEIGDYGRNFEEEEEEEYEEIDVLEFNSAEKTIERKMKQLSARKPSPSILSVYPRPSVSRGSQQPQQLQLVSISRCLSTRVQNR